MHTNNTQLYDVRITEVQRGVLTKALDRFIKSQLGETEADIDELEDAVNLLARIDDSDYPLPAVITGQVTALF